MEEPQAHRDRGHPEPLGRLSTALTANAFDDQENAKDKERDCGGNADDPRGQSRTENVTNADCQGVGGDHAECRSEPGSEQAVIAGEGDGGEHGLVAEFGKKEGPTDREQDGTRTLELGFFSLVFGEFVSAQRPRRKTEKREASDDIDDVCWKSDTNNCTQHHAREMYNRGGESNSDKDGDGAVTRCERHRHQLAFVAHFSEKDDAETQKESVHVTASVAGGDMNDRLLV